jgi:hypothetical protein
MEVAMWKGDIHWLRRAEVLAVVIVQVAYAIAVVPSLATYLAVVREFGAAYQSFWHLPHGSSSWSSRAASS